MYKHINKIKINKSYKYINMNKYKQFGYKQLSEVKSKYTYHGTIWKSDMEIK